MCLTLGSEQGTHNPALVAVAGWCLGFLVPGSSPREGWVS